MRVVLKYLVALTALIGGLGPLATSATAESIAKGSSLDLSGLVSCTSSECSFGRASTLNGTGSFSGFGYGNAAVFSSLPFGNFTPKNLYSATSATGQVASFYATSLTSSTMTSPAGFINYSFAFEGVASLTGFDDTSGLFNLTTNQFGATLGSFSATTIASAAPEPAAWGMMILGFGVIGCALRRRRNITGAAYAA